MVTANVVATLSSCIQLRLIFVLLMDTGERVFQPNQPHKEIAGHGLHPHCAMRMLHALMMILKVFLAHDELATWLVQVLSL